MWNRRKEDDYIPARPTSTPSSSTDIVRDVPPAPVTPTRTYEPEPPMRSAGSATIGKSVIIKGNILSRENLTIDGEVEGTVECQEHCVTVGPNGRLGATVKAREICVLGTIHGNVEATEKIDIRKDAKLVGDIKTARIVIEDGAYFKGSIDIIKTEVKPAPAPKQQQAAAQPKDDGPKEGKPVQQPLAAGEGKR